MDGTLLDSKDIISEENLAALRKLQQNGTEIIIATGRLDLMVKRYILQLGLKGYIISCNGGLIRNIDTGEVVYASVMDSAVVKKIISDCLKEQINFLVYTADLIYSNRTNPRAIKYEAVNESLRENLRFPMKYIDAQSIKSGLKEEILKILFICDSKEQVDKLQKRYSVYNNLTVVSSSEGLLDIMASGTSKGKALQILADKRKVNPEHIIAFGDNYNDIDMLGSVGMPVAKENSVEELKEAAKFITKSNDESGIAYAIDYLLHGII
jgi:Cof subfamily protein (haloacid dehalogenase superfamily)